MEHAWLDLGLLDKTQLVQLARDLSTASKMVRSRALHALVRLPCPRQRLFLLTALHFLPPRFPQSSALSSSARHSVTFRDSWKAIPTVLSTLICACARYDTGLRRIDGVSEETDADGEVTNTFEYFRQPEEELGNLTTDIKPDVTNLPEETARSFSPALWFHATCCA